MDIEDLKIYNMAMELGEEVWQIVANWSYFDKDTIGKQWIRAADSIGANISEGYGRYHFKDTKNFGFFSRGSLFETKTWLVKAHKRNLVSGEKFQKLTEEIRLLGKMLNGYIKSIGATTNEPNQSTHL